MLRGGHLRLLHRAALCAAWVVPGPWKVKATYLEEPQESWNRAGSTSYRNPHSLKILPKQITGNFQWVLFLNFGKHKPFMTPSSQTEQLKLLSGEWALGPGLSAFDAHRTKHVLCHFRIFQERLKCP